VTEVDAALEQLRDADDGQVELLTDGG